MDSYDKTYLDIDELAKRIEDRIKELEKKSVPLKGEEYTSKKVEKNMSDLDDIIRQIDERIREIEKDQSKEININVDDLTKKVNSKLSKLDDVSDEDAGKTLYDLSEISNAINETIKALEDKRKKKKQQKAKYCDLARKKAYEQKKNNK